MENCPCSFVNRVSQLLSSAGWEKNFKCFRLCECTKNYSLGSFFSRIKKNSKSYLRTVPSNLILMVLGNNGGLWGVVLGTANENTHSKQKSLQNSVHGHRGFSRGQHAASENSCPPQWCNVTPHLPSVKAADTTNPNGFRGWGSGSSLEIGWNP